MRDVMENTDRILLHLLRFNHIKKTDKRKPHDMCQAGISKALELHFVSVYRYMRKLVERKMVTAHKSYVNGFERTVFTYHLTSVGYDRAMALKTNNSPGNHREIIELYRRFGRVHWLNGEFATASEEYDKAIGMCKKHDCSDLEVDVMIDCGNLKSAIGDVEIAESYYGTALEIATHIGVETGRILNNWGVLRRKCGDFKGAIEYCLKSIDSTNIYDRGHAALEVSYCYAKLGESDKALEYVNIARKIFEKIKDYAAIATVYLVSGMIERNKGNYEKARKLIETGMEKNALKDAVQLYKDELKATEERMLEEM